MQMGAANRAMLGDDFLFSVIFGAENRQKMSTFGPNEANLITS